MSVAGCACEDSRNRTAYNLPLPVRSNSAPMATMNEPNEKRAHDLFEAWRVAEPEETFVDLLARHPELDVELRARKERDESLASSALLFGNPSTTAPAPLPERLGDYRILDELGRGGMGVVYRAEQESPQRAVALKVIRGRLDSPEVRRRFDYEVAVLGRLRHPGIAQIHEAGSTELASGESIPFFAMELVEGSPLLEHASDRRLSVEAKLELFVKICEAVHFAHQQGVIHRDLKPSNILVDAFGAPKVLDFGIARATEREAGDTETGTELGQTPGTLAYMSPEQLGGDPSLLDTRTDVYSLGVVLFELLAGRSPYDLEGRSTLERVRIIREDEPCRLGSLDRGLAGDLETIVSTALAKDKARRYGSVSELAADVQRHLGHEPIEARPASTWYVVRKFARRHRVLVGASAVVMVTLIVATIVSLRSARQARVAEQDERLASQGARKAEEDARAAATVADLARREAEDALTSSALIAARGGFWEANLQSSEKALGFDPLHAPELRLERVRAFIALNRAGEAFSELDRLEQHEDLDPPVRVAAQLWRGDLLLAGSLRDERGLALVRSAFESGELDAADRAYAAALLAESSTEVVRWLQEAVELEPAHVRANELLAFYLTLSGRFDEAETQLAVFHALYPADPGERVLSALAAALRGDVEAADAFLNSVPQIAEETRQTFRGLFQSYSRLSDLPSWIDQPNLIPMLVLEVMSISASLERTQNDPNARLIMPLPQFMPRLLSHVVAGLRATLQAQFLGSMGRGKWEEAAQSFRQAVEIHPDGVIFVLLAQSEDMGGHPRQAIASARRAVEARSIFRGFQTVAHERLITYLTQQVIGSKFEAEKDALKAELRLRLRDWHEVAPWPRPFMAFMSQFAWLMTHDHRLARQMLDDWLVAEPDETPSRLNYVRFVADDRDESRAIDFIEQLEALEPPLKEELRFWLRETRQRLQRNAEAVLERLKN